ncbi:ARID DNA-binding domain-containing protein [Tanacetum coccineum]
MVNTNTFIEDRWSNLKSSGIGQNNMWYQSKILGRPLRKKLQYGFIQRQLKREREARLGNCIRQITHDCKEMLKSKLEEIELYNSAIPQTQSQNILQNINRRQKCYKCRQRGHIIKNCPIKEKKHVDGTEKYSGTSETAETKGLTKGTGMKFGEVVIINGDEKYLIPGLYYAPEVTLNILSIEQLERQGVEIKKYFESVEEGNHSDAENKTVGLISMENNLIEIKGVIYSTKVNTFDEYVAFLNLIKQDEIISQQWDAFREKFDKVVKWFYKSYLERPIPGPIPPKINGVEIHMLDLYKLVEGLGGYLSGAKTRTQPPLDIPTEIVEEDKEYTCLTSRQCDIAEIKAPSMETANRKGKAKRIENFGVKLEDINEVEDPDSQQFQPTQPNNEGGPTLNKDIQTMIKTSTISEPADKEYNGSTSSDDLFIIV